MANLTEAASIGQIQEELSFHSFMLSTIDPDDEEAEERTMELNETLRHLRGLLEQKEDNARPQTPLVASVPGAGHLTGSLPSRSRPVHEQHDPLSSPLDNYNRQFAVPDEMHSPVHTAAASSRDGNLSDRKRQSRGSMDCDSEQPGTKRSALDPQNILAYQRRQMERAEQIEREKEDMEMARRLSSTPGQGQASNNVPSSQAQGLQRSTQAFLDRKGGVYSQPSVFKKRSQVPSQNLAPGPVSNVSSWEQPKPQHVPGTNYRNHSGYTMANGSTIAPSLPPINSQNSGGVGQIPRMKSEPNSFVQPSALPAEHRRPTQHSIDSSDSDSLVEISASQFAQASPQPSDQNSNKPSGKAAAYGAASVKEALRRRQEQRMKDIAQEVRQGQQPQMQPNGAYGQGLSHPHQLTQPYVHGQVYNNGSHPGYYPAFRGNGFNHPSYAVGGPFTTQPIGCNYGIPNGAQPVYQPANSQNVPNMAYNPYPPGYNNPTFGQNSAPTSLLSSAMNYGREALSNVGQWAMNGWANYTTSLDGDDSGSDSDIQEIWGRRKVSDFDTTLRRHGLTHMLNDPQRDREELQKLLENIRPDEDLPEHLMQDSPAELAAPLMAHQKKGLAWLKQQEEGNNKGGVLADDMGLGKTIQALALIVTRPSSEAAMKTTLIVAPVALLKQWQREIKNKIRRANALKSYIFHGGGKKKLTFASLSTYDIVLTTFGTVASEYKRKELFEEQRKRTPDMVEPNLPLLGERSRWYRVIVDEAQCIKNKGTVAAKGAITLKATYRLCMSGTPMMNNVGEMYSLINFLRITPYNDYTKFQSTFGRPLAKPGNSRSSEQAMKTFQALLKSILLRRTKKSTIDGKPILQLKERFDEKVHAVFSEEQKDFYEHIEKNAQIRFNRYLKAGTVLKNYSHILTLLLRLRQCADHPDLVKDQSLSGNNETSLEEMTEFAKELKEEVVMMIKESNGSFECPICYDAPENPTIFFPCGHDVCSECFARLTDPAQMIANGDEHGSAKCPECRNKIEPKKVINYSVFKKVHQPEECEEENELLPKAEESAASDSDSDDDDETDNEADEVDSQGDLRDFIVPDDAEEREAEEADNEDEGDQSNRDEADDASVVPKKRKGKASMKAKGKGKAKAAEKDKKKKKEPRSQRKPKVTLAELKKQGMRNAAAKKRYLRRIRRDWVSSAKIDKVMEILKDIRDRGEGEKTLIFSQWTSMLDLMEVPIDDEGIRYRRYDGSMSAGLRDEAVSDFDDKPEVTVMLVSLKAGNAGLNLTSASQVIILDPFWNPFIEEQAIDRAHRIGQMRNVCIHRILVQGTVEDRIEDIKDEKRNLIEAALDEGAARDMGRLNVQQLSYLFGLSRSAS